MASQFQRKSPETGTGHWPMCPNVYEYSEVDKVPKPDKPMCMQNASSHGNLLKRSSVWLDGDDCSRKVSCNGFVLLVKL